MYSWEERGIPRLPGEVRVLCTGDWHIHPWQEAERPTRWRDDCLRVVDDLHTAARITKADAVVFLGDLYEDKRKARHDLCAQTIDAIDCFARCVKVPIMWLSGNHDSFYPDIASILPLYRTNLYRISSLCTPPVGEFAEEYSKVLFCPWGIGSNISEELTNYSVLFCHTTFSGISVNAGTSFESADGLPAELTAPKPGRRLIVSGHYHNPQFIKGTAQRLPVLCVGAPIMHDWSDLEPREPRGFVLLRLLPDGIKIVRLPISQNYPRFWRERTAQTKPTDFVLSEIVRKDITEDASQHDNVVQIAQAGSLSAIKAYVDEQKPEASKQERNEFYKIGCDLLGQQPEEGDDIDI